MKQKRIESQTTQILFQSPTAEEQRVSRADVFKANVKDFGLFIVFAFVAWVLVSALISFVWGG